MALKNLRLEPLNPRGGTMIRHGWHRFPLTPSFAEASAADKALADRPAGRPALSPRRECPEIFSRIAPMNRGERTMFHMAGTGSPSPRPSPLGEGESSPVAVSFDGSSDRMVHGSWAERIVASRSVNRSFQRLLVPRFMGSCLFRWELLTDPEPRSGVCPSRAQQRPLPEEGWKVPIIPPGRAWLRPGRAHSGAIARRVTTPVIHGSWAGRIIARRRANR